MSGFFSLEQTQSLLRSDRGVLSCQSCQMYKSARSPKMLPYGLFSQRIMVIGEAPGADEDAVGRPWQGRMGTLLQQRVAHLGLDLFADCISLNAVNCRPYDNRGNNRSPTNHEIACCRQNVVQAIRTHKPHTIILLGGAALESLIGHRWSSSDLGGISRWRGWMIPDREYNAWVCPAFHPSYVQRQRHVTAEVDVIWTRDLRQAMSSAALPLPDIDSEENRVTIVTGEDDVEQSIRQLIDQCPPLLAFDIETTGLQPYDAKAHEILSISFCAHEDNAVAMLFPKRESSRRALAQLLHHPKIGKIAANMKFEDTWLSVLHGIEVHPWVFDTMQAAHILDNRPGITGLKFQAFVQFGLLGYDKGVAPYMTDSGDGGVNRVAEMMRDPSLLRTLLLYNGVDSLVEYRLAQRQMSALDIT